jgi:hypothetical protein
MAFPLVRCRMRWMSAAAAALIGGFGDVDDTRASLRAAATLKRTADVGK